MNQPTCSSRLDPHPHARPGARSGFVLLALLAAPLTGCITGSNWGPGPDGDGQGELVIDVLFSGETACDAAGVDQVELLFRNKEETPTTVSCDQHGVRFDVYPLAVGSHEITAEGLKAGVVTFSLTKSVYVQPGFQEIGMNLEPVSQTLTPPVTATLTINVQFAGQTTCAAAGVDTMRLTFPNGDAASQSVSCGATAVLLVVPMLPVGIHNVTVDGLATGTVIFDLTSDVTVVAGGTTVTMDLTAAAPAPQASVLASFIFGGVQTSDPFPVGMTCAEAGVASVSVTIDTAAPVVVACQNPTSLADAATVPVTAGTHSFAWQAFASTDGSGTALYSTTLTEVTVQGSANQPMAVNMAGLQNGGFTLDWSFAGQSCSQAGVATVTYTVADALGNELPGMPATAACSTLGFTYAASPGLTAGVYVLVSIAADDANGNELFHGSDFRMYAPAGGDPTFNDTLTAG